MGIRYHKKLQTTSSTGAAFGGFSVREARRYLSLLKPILIK